MTHTKEIAGRMVDAELNFLAVLMEFGGITKDQAQKVAALYHKNKLTRRDVWMGKISVKHGAFLDRDVIRRAAGLV